MLRTLALATALLVPASAFAHNEGHVEMSMTTELGHMFSDPVHLGLIIAVLLTGIVIWKGLIAPVKRESETLRNCHD
ncbi:MAG: hypothetical protein NUV50_07360 [Rhodospirillales bacterium]|nr:hypothetical protein [Rhodospirillales bacterium]